MRRDLLPMIQEALRDRYTVEREMARGGAGRVFFARNLEGTAVALKVLHPELVVTATADRFLREIKTLSRLEHPHVAKLLDYGERDWLVYLAMAYIEGPTLKEHIAQVRRVSVSDAVRIARALIASMWARTASSAWAWPRSFGGRGESVTACPLAMRATSLLCRMQASGPTGSGARSKEKAP